MKVMFFITLSLLIGAPCALGRLDRGLSRRRGPVVGILGFFGDVVSSSPKGPIGPQMVGEAGLEPALPFEN